jgi:hypothetical protein
MKLTIDCIARLPALAWAAEIREAGHAVHVVCGAAVEADASGIVAGAWAGDFAQGDIAGAATSIGTGLRLASQGLIAVVGTASTAPLHRWRGTGQARGRVVLSNSLALALAAAGDRLVASYPFYPHILYSIVLGPRHYRAEIPVAGGRLAVHYRSVAIDVAGRATALPAPRTPGFADFTGYRALLLAEIAALFANAADPARRMRYAPIASLSAGYDSPASAALARQVGCRQAFTFRQSIDGGGTPDDSGEGVARALGLEIAAFDTFAYRQRTDLPEVEFLAASFGGGNVYLAGSGDLLAGRVVVSGGGGDYIWDRDYAARWAPISPPYLGGYSVNEFYLRQAALDFSVPAIAADRARDIGRLSRAPEMLPWTVGGDYDRPIARRIVEEAGVGRGTFAGRKRLVTPVYDSITRRAPPLDGFLTNAGLAAFERWFEETRPIDRIRALGHRLPVETLGKIVWSGKLRRWFLRRGLHWPPLAGRLWHWRVPMRKNAFVFNWAVGRQLAMYRRALDLREKGDGSDAGRPQG